MPASGATEVPSLVAVASARITGSGSSPSERGLGRASADCGRKKMLPYVSTPPRVTLECGDTPRHPDRPWQNPQTIESNSRSIEQHERPAGPP